MKKWAVLLLFLAGCEHDEMADVARDARQQMTPEARTFLVEMAADCLQKQALLMDDGKIAPAQIARATVGVCRGDLTLSGIDQRTANEQVIGIVLRSRAGK